MKGGALLFHSDSTASSINASMAMRAAIRRVVHTPPASHSRDPMESAALPRPRGAHPSPTSAAAILGSRATG